MTTPIARLFQQPVGSNPARWGLIQGEANELLEQAFGGLSSVAHDDRSSTLDLTANSQTATDGQGDDQSRAAVIEVTGNLSADRSIGLPNSQKTYILKNSTNRSIEFSAGGFDTITLPNGAVTPVYADGAGNLEAAVNWAPSLTLGEATSFSESGGQLRINTSGFIVATVGDGSGLQLNDDDGLLLRVSRDPADASMTKFEIGGTTVTDDEIEYWSDTITDTGIELTQLEIRQANTTGTSVRDRAPQIELTGTGTDAELSVTLNASNEPLVFTNPEADSFFDFISFNRAKAANSSGLENLGRIGMQRRRGTTDEYDLVFHLGRRSVTLTQIMDAVGA